MSKFEEVLKRLLKLTEEGKQAWSETPDDSTFATTFSNGSSLLISKSIQIYGADVDDYAETRINAKLLNNSGQIVEEYEAPETGWLASLYSEARAKARRRDDVLDDIWNEIAP